MKKLIFLVSFFSMVSVYAQSSKYLDQVPVYPNAFFLEDASRSIREGAFFRVKDEFEGMSILSFEVKAFSVNASQDEVINFYKKKLNATVVREGARFPTFSDIKPNSSTRVFFEQSVLLTTFVWNKKESSGDILHYYITVSDSTGFRGARGQTILGLNFKLYSRTAKKYVPTEEELGAPIYRNSKYAPEQSNKNAVMGNHTFVSEDDLSAVVAFFEEELHVKANSGVGLKAGEKNAHFMNFSVKHPDNAISIEQEQFQGKQRVRIYYICLMD